jgi:predicted nucleic acid-binding protein
MPVLVLDASVIIDLERGGLLETTFKLSEVFVTPDLLYQNELEAEGGPYLLELGLRVVELDPDEMVIAQKKAKDNRKLSNADCWAAVMAMRDDHRLLTGDGLLRSFANDNNIPCSGVLWILDRIFDAEVVSPMVLVEGLSRIKQHPRCWLPEQEISSRIAKWTAAIE